MVKVSIIGSGKVAHHLITAFLNSNKIELVDVFARNTIMISKAFPQLRITDDIRSLRQADIFIMAVSDTVISTVSKEFTFQNSLVVHTSGSGDMKILDGGNRRGVFYPLQTFSTNKPLDFKVIPICIEAENDADRELLQKVARSISNVVQYIDSKQRKALHIAAVFVNNFTNHLYKIANDICDDQQLPFDLLKPLISETSEKVLLISPLEAQTGPALRNDRNTIDLHLDFLTDENQKLIYSTITKSIQNGYEL